MKFSVEGPQTKDGLTPNQPQPLSRVHVGTAPGRDLRWRGVAHRECVKHVVVVNGRGYRAEFINRLDVHESNYVGA